MSVLSDLETALEWQQGCDEMGIAYEPSPCKLTYDLLDLDTIAALVAVAEAADTFCVCERGGEPISRLSMEAALAPLVKEADDE